jgi:F420-dependent oxidoreductase-like protein
MKSKVGVIVPQGWRLDLPREMGAQEQFELVAQTAERLESLGYHSAWLYDHFHTYPVVKEESVFEAWTALTALAGRTKKLRLGTIVTCNSYRNPALLAKMTSTFDVISGGRLELGIGAGWYEDEYRGYGYRFDSNADRIRMLSEAVRIIKEMWTEGKSSFHGKYYQPEGAINYPRPVQKPHPPILIGGGGEQLTLKVVARYADKFNTGGDPATYRHKLDVLARHCDAVGRNYNGIEKTYMATVSIAEERSAAERKIEEFASHFGGLPEFRKKHAIGTPADVASYLKQFLDMGVTGFILYFRDALEKRSLELFEEQVMPELT